ncbi:MAG: alpha/beta hydrolase [Deltaproteobacteria bacterium]|nr:alpha/beta hydrolase [Deltaproteobacteria bacterium]
MKKRNIVLLVLVLLVLFFILFPKVYKKDNMAYDDAVAKWAKGKFVLVDNKKVHYLEQGEGKPIILIHGFLYNTVMWKKNIEDLAKKFKVYVIDLWGWGYSERLKELNYSYELYGKQIVGFMDTLKISKASLVGQSMGGGISVYVAALFPDRVDKLILVDPAVIPYPMTATGRVYQLPYVGEFLNAIPGNALIKKNIQTVWFYDPTKVTDDYVEEVARPLYIKGSLDGLMYILRNVLKEPYVEAEAQKLAQLNKPILIIHGREDKAIPLDRSQKLNALWKGSQLVIFEKAGHTPQEEYPEKFNPLAVGFLTK